jgi:lysophospholipase L1-like esterase
VFVRNPVTFALIGFVSGLMWLRFELFPIKTLKRFTRILRQSPTSPVKNSDFDNLRDQFKQIAPQHKIVMFGDSIIQLGLWQELMPEVLLHNRGISGDRSIEALDRVEDVLSLSPEICIMYLGINDVIHNISISETLSNIENIVMILKNQGIAVVLIELYNSDQNPVPGFSQQVRKINDGYLRLSRELEFEFLQIGPPATQIQCMNDDRIHLNGWGYRFLAREILAKIS